MSELPKWIREVESFRTSDAAVKGLVDALSIAWGALERINSRAIRIRTGEVKTKVHGASDYDNQVCEDAMRRIAELDK